MFSPEYKALQEQFHRDRQDYGVSGSKYAPHIQNLADKLQTHDILDYGAGKGTLQKSLPYPIQNYDPFIPEFSKRPRPARIVVCTDVLEHIEPEHLSAVLHDIRSLTLDLAFLQIATRPAVKVLPDGRNAHLIIESINWWLERLMPYFSTNAVQDIGGGFLYVGAPIQAGNPS